MACTWCELRLRLANELARFLAGQEDIRSGFASLLSLIGRNRCSFEVAPGQQLDEFALLKEAANSGRGFGSL